jgi:Polyketide cyclase / dehydrase and lipid transport
MIANRLRHTLHLLMGSLLFLATCVALAQDFPQTSGSPFDLKVSVERSGSIFQVQATYVAPVSECQAYAFLTDYESAKNIPGISESKIIQRNGPKVQVERIAEERVLLIPIYLRSLLEFSEVSERRLEFHQLEGHAKFYKGSWQLEPEKNGTRFTHLASFELETSIPLFLVQYFLENRANRRFEIMAERVSQSKLASTQTCKRYASL